jgi:1,4-alpha-glucan branching enzyme
MKKLLSRLLEGSNTFSLLTEYDIYLFKQGKHFRLYEKLGAHEATHEEVPGIYFALWAPNAKKVSVIGEFNQWNKKSHALTLRKDDSGIWEGWFSDVPKNTDYKFFLKGKKYEGEKTDPLAFLARPAPNTSSVVWDTWYAWHDEEWMKNRASKNGMHDSPLLVYELHMGSWRRSPDDPDKVLGYREIAEALIPYIKKMGFTHVEFLPVMEHPYYASWGYQITNYYAACSRYGYPQDLMFLIDELHRNDIGVILDWVPSHFPGDVHGLRLFDGTALYEYYNFKKAFQPDWNSFIFDYGKNEVRSFLISNACFWLDRYHADGLRVDAVASMLHLNFSKKEGEWIPNEQGGSDNLEAIEFLKQLNITVHHDFPDILMIAEESTTFPKVTFPVYDGGLGFDMKWMLGWMNDTLDYFEKDPIYRNFHHDLITFSLMYIFSEKFMLPLSHDEVVHLKKSLISKMPGDEWQQFANLRALFVYMFTLPGTKLLFMGSEFGQRHEWRHDHSLDWHEAKEPAHLGLQTFVSELVHLCRKETALFEQNFDHWTFEWIEVNDHEKSVFVYARKGRKEDDYLIVALNLTTIPRTNYRCGAPCAGTWIELLNSDDLNYFGSAFTSQKEYQTESIAEDGRNDSLQLNLPPLSGIILKLKKKSSG